jgi:hypothetical protein
MTASPGVLLHGSADSPTAHSAQKHLHESEDFEDRSLIIANNSIRCERNEQSTCKKDQADQNTCADTVHTCMLVLDLGYFRPRFTNDRSQPWSLGDLFLPDNSNVALGPELSRSLRSPFD